MSDVPDAPVPAPAADDDDDDVIVDLAAFLPEGTTLAGVGEPAASEAEGPGAAIEAPSAIDPAVDGPEAGAAAASGAPADPSDASGPSDASDPSGASWSPAAAGAHEPVAPTRAPLDVAVLERIEGELAAVDAALVAIDAGEPGRSALLAELLADDPPAS